MSSANAIPVSSQRKVSTYLSRGLLLMLIVGLCVTNALLIKQNRDLKAFIARGQPEFLKPGQQVTTLAGTTLSGQRRVVNYGSRAKTVLLVFSPQCNACERTAPYWRKVLEASIRNQYQVFGVSLGDASRSNLFLASNGLELETLCDIDTETRAAYKFTLTPLTLVVDSNGRVEKIWPGAFSQQSKPDVEEYFGISVTDGK